MYNAIPIELLRSGEQGRVIEIDGDQSLVHRLAEMGLCVGQTVRMVRPGSPCILAVDHQRISFRGEQAGAVVVEPGPIAAGESQRESSPAEV